MKAISLWQPWAGLVAIGAKTIETRSWGTDYRGPLAIHAAKHGGQLPSYDAIHAALQSGLRFHELAQGAIVATCELFDCMQITERGLESLGYVESLPTGPELLFGDYTPGRFAWLLRNVKQLPKPIPLRGRQRIFNLPDALLPEPSP